MISTRYSEDNSIHSAVDSLSDQSQVKTPASARPRQIHKPTVTSRRQSQLLYAEKYGLNSTEWKTTQYEDDDDDDDNRPLSMQPRSYSYFALTNNTNRRPRSIFNLMEHSTTTVRPSNFVKPAPANVSSLYTVPDDMISFQRLYDQYQKKVYIEGFVFKRTEYNSDGSLCQDEWSKLYVELSGPILSLWDGRKLNDLNNTSGTILPHYINVMDATVNLMKDTTDMVILNTAGRNQYLIRPEPRTSSAAQQWVTAIRLSCFECARLFEIYTRSLLLRPIYKHVRQLSTKQQQQQKRRMEGFVQARLTGDTEWKKYWVVVCDQRDEKRLFGKTKSVPCKGQLLFYQSKKSKYPSYTMINIVQAYTLYPETPQLIDMATMFKVEGTTMTTTDLKSGEQGTTQHSTGTLLMASNTKELVQWLMAVFDVFKLYGRPTCLLDDPCNPSSLNFGETSNTDSRLFLESSDVMHLPIQNVTLLDSKTAFMKVMAQKMLKTASSCPTMPLSASKPRANSAPLLSNMAPDHIMNQQHKVSQSNSLASIPHRASVMSISQSHPMIYASDDSDEDNTEESDDDDQSDGDSLFISTSTPQFMALNDNSNKELQSATEPSTPSPITSVHPSKESTKILSVADDEYQNKNGDNMMDFAKNLLSTFGTEPMPTTTSSNNSMTSLTNINSQSLSPVHTASPLPTAATNIDDVPTRPVVIDNKIPISKRMSVAQLPSDDEDSDNNHDDENDGHGYIEALGKMKISTSSSSFSSSGRPLSTTMLSSSTAATTPSTTFSNRSSAATNSEGSSSSNTSTSGNSLQQQYQQQLHGKMKRQSVVPPQPMKSTSTATSLSRQQRRSSSMGLVHKIDYMQQQQQQQQQQQLHEQQSLWETGSLMGTDPRIASYEYKPQQQQQQSYRSSMETASMNGNVGGGIDPRIAMYRQGGSMYNGVGSSGGSMYSGIGGSGGSMYGGADDYQRMMPGQPLVHMETKPSEPRSGLVGMISQLEDEKREKEKNRFSTTMSTSSQQQQFQDQLLYQQQLLQQQMMMNNPYMMNPMMMNTMMMNPMMMNTMMMNPMMMNPMMMQPWSVNGNYGMINHNQPLKEEDDEEDDDVPLARPMTANQSRNRRQSTSRY
ncbi:uncharacterized protein BX664DRAFT_386360 [Halteromyces radiatus]|uniref:uncharacterized protein n=1 Tax=Halteromyces radiatus TaxID=101107 RepID=UPI00221F1A11|nr:uncharacterized protein BX664DRAFT_386360 [Halteromyces radiatus]KAI8089961.1 hypothetical protein BX664DRAFT_386360 [Halteromyces radiatus]